MVNDRREWLEADGLGGFASGTVCGERTRRYHALLLAATNPPTDRFVLVNGWEGSVTTPGGTYPLTTQRYVPDVVHPDGARWLTRFHSEPWPTWHWEFPDGTRVRMDLFVPHESAAVVLRWELNEPSGQPVVVTFRPLFSGRDFHALHHENTAFQFTPEPGHRCWTWCPYDGVPKVTVIANGSYRHDPVWYRQFLYGQEQARGLDCIEDLASPGEFQFDLLKAPAACVLTARVTHAVVPKLGESTLALANRLAMKERRRRESFPSPLERAADAFVVRRGNGRTIIAGYPWFADWGRDTFIAMRGLCLSTGRLEEAGTILVDWAGCVSEGMLPNRFPDRGETPEYNSVDASLWYVIAVHDYLEAAAAADSPVSHETLERLWGAVEDIIAGFQRGTRFGIKADDDGLLRAGVGGVQLTWMDAKVGDWVVTPRVGKPVEIQALWINALWIAAQRSPRWRTLYDAARAAFEVRFWNWSEECLYDVIDVDHLSGHVDASVRPNQIFAIGGLPLTLLDRAQARKVVDKVKHELWTPLGLRTLSPRSQDYRPDYRGGVLQRDGAYHQGTAWPWLLGAFVEAWLRVNGQTQENVSLARKQFLQPLLDHLNDFGIGHVAEVADGESANGAQQPGGCPFQAWSLGELLRIRRLLDSKSLPEDRPQNS